MNMGGGASNVFDIFREKLCNSRRSSNQSAKLLEAMSARTSGDRPGTRRLSLGGAEQHIKSLSMCHIEVQRSFHCRSSEDISTHQFRAQCNCSSPNGLMEMRRIGTSTDLSQYNRKDILMLFLVKKSLKIPKRQSQSVYQRRKDNTMVKRKSTKGQTTIYITYT